MARKVVVMAVGVAGLGAVVVIVTVCAVMFNRESDATTPVPMFSTGGDMLDYLKQLGYIGERDGLLVTWYHRANNKEEMSKALASDAMILEADVILDGSGTPIMAHPPENTSDNTLDQWLDAVLSSQKGIKLDFKSLDSAELSLDILSRKNASDRINKPLWLNADIVLGPNVPNFLPAINATRFLQLTQEKFWDSTLSPGWKAAYIPPLLVGTYTRKMVEEMYNAIKDVPQRVTFPVHAMMVRSGWQHISWILSQSSKYSLTLWQGSIHPTVEDLLFVRDNSHPARVYYDIYEPTLSEFKQAAKKKNRLRKFYPGGDLINFLRGADNMEDGFVTPAGAHRDSLAVSWFTVTDESSLVTRLSDQTGGMLVLHLVPHSQQPNVPVVEASGSRALSLEETLELLGQHAHAPWGIYLRIHSYGILEVSLDLLHQAYSSEKLYRPVWISVEDGHSWNGTTDFVSTVETLFPYVTLVLVERERPPVLPAAVTGLSQRVALHLKAASVLRREDPLHWLAEVTDRQQVVFEGNKRDLTVLKQLVAPLTGRENTRLYATES